MTKITTAKNTFFNTLDERHGALIMLFSATVTALAIGFGIVSLF